MATFDFDVLSPVLIEYGFSFDVYSPTFVTYGRPSTSTEAVSAAVQLQSAVGKLGVLPLKVTGTAYRQRAYNTLLGQYVYWTTYGSPDLTGSASGYLVENLTDIAVIAVI